MGAKTGPLELGQKFFAFEKLSLNKQQPKNLSVGLEKLSNQKFLVHKKIFLGT